MYCELKCNLFWYCRTAEDTLQRLRFLLLLTYLLSVVISRRSTSYRDTLLNTRFDLPPGPLKL